MTWRSHLLLGADTLWLLAAVPSGLSSNIGLLAMCACVGALLPDLDASDAKVRHIVSVGSVEPFGIIGDLVHGTLGHRGVFHSALGLCAVSGLSLLASAWLHVGWLPAMAVSLGFASHLLADGCTPAGVPLWRAGKRVHLLPRPLRVTTGSVAEQALLPLFAFPILLLLLRALIAPS